MFKVGDEVRIRKDSWYYWYTGQIEVWEIISDDGWIYKVKWKFFEWTFWSNSYTNGDLELLVKTPPVDMSVYAKTEKRISIIDCAVWTKLEVWGFPCKYSFNHWMLGVLYRGYLYSSSFYWEPEEFIRANKEIIRGFFIHKVDEEVDGIMKKLEVAQTLAISDIDGLILDDTRDLILSRVFETTTKYVSKISDKLTDKSLKAKFKKALWI